MIYTRIANIFLLLLLVLSQTSARHEHPTPAPSEFPSAAPTTTHPSATPSSSPSFQPTTTRFPTVSPSNMPSLMPSSAPTKTPSVAPSISARPSSTPSALPSATPSIQPTVSAPPSSMPSSSPTISAMPSSAPTYIESKTASFQVTVRLVGFMNSATMSDFERATATFIDMKDTNLSQTHVRVTDQRQNSIGTRRMQSSATASQGLTILFDVTSTYIGPDTNYVLQKELDPSFQQEDELWTNLLSNHNEFFLPLRRSGAVGVEAPQDGRKSSRNDGLSTGGKVGIIILCLVASVVAVGAAMFAVRSYREVEHRTELVSPAKHRSFGQPTFSVDSMDMRRVVVPPSPNTMELGIAQNMRAANSGVLSVESSIREPGQHSPKNAHTIFRDRQPPSSKEGRTHEDPPMDIAKAVKSQSLFDEATDLSQQTEQQPSKAGNGRRSTYEPSEVAFSEANFGNTRGARLGAKGPDSPAKAAYSQAKTFFSNLVGYTDEVSKSNEVDKRTSMDSQKVKNAVLTPGKVRTEEDFRSAGIYDVFAPAGPIGVVVDTTKHGPVVHSLKNTSPMLGLINPGDLIIGLDDEDTRRMTAATLTRLMASKANQSERKITLLAKE